jgi:hypothetical protein
MPKANLNKQSKRQREHAKKDKRDAKDAKRAQRKEDNRVGTPAATPPAAPTPMSIAAAAFVKRMKIGS